MDPVMQEELKRLKNDHDEVEVVMRLHEVDSIPDKVRVVSQFGEVITCRIRKGDIQEVYNSSKKRSLKACRLMGSQNFFGHPIGNFFSKPKRKPPFKKKSNVIIAALDWGLDIAHPNFLNPDGTTRILALWDQSAKVSKESSPTRYGYGKVHYQKDINQALKSGRPYQYLNFHPSKGDPLGIGSHGTHTVDIAAGNGTMGRVGIAPNTDIIFVHLAAKNTGGRYNLGSSGRMLEAIDFIRKIAADRPLVINISAGRHGGPHTGFTMVEMGMDHFLKSRTNTMICQSVGNYRTAQTHHAGIVRPGKKQSFSFILDRNDTNGAEIEIYYDQRDQFKLWLRNKVSGVSIRSIIGTTKDIILDNKIVGRIYHRSLEPNSHKNHVDIFLYASSPKGIWEITLKGEKVLDGRYHSWIEREGGIQTRFLKKYSDSSYTNNTISNGFNTLVVGAYNPYSVRFKMAPFSSKGPTVDGRFKPDLIAPGVNIVAARSTPKKMNSPNGGLTKMSGTSMAAPHVTGTCARLLEYLPTGTPFWKIKNIIIGNADPVKNFKDIMLIGGGRLNIKKSINAVKNNNSSISEQFKSVVNMKNTIKNTINNPVFFEAIDAENRLVKKHAEMVLTPNTESFLNQMKWIGFKFNTVKIAKEEFLKWNSGTKKEWQQSAESDLKKYWTKGVRISYPGHSTAWSAAFISWVMRTAGAGSNFRYSGAHWRYISAAKQNRLNNRTSNPFWTYRLTEVKPELGDLVCNARAGSGLNYNNIERGGFTHCDLVVEVLPNKIKVIGGNVRNSVSEKTIYLNSNGFIDRRKHPKHFAIIKVRTDNNLSSPVTRNLNQSNPNNIDIDKAIRLNKWYQNRFNWRSQLKEINQILGLNNAAPSDASFALAVANFQKNQNFPSHQIIGILGPLTLKAMQPFLRSISVPLPTNSTPRRPAGFNFGRRNRGLTRYGGGRLENTLRSLRSQGTISITDDEIDTLQRISNVETRGLLQGLNTWDSAVVSIGFMQFTLQHGKLQEWIDMVPDEFKRFGIELDKTAPMYIWKKRSGRISSQGYAIKGVPNKNDLRWGVWAQRFFRAGLDPAIIQAEVELAKSYLKRHIIGLKSRLKRKGEPASTFNIFMRKYRNSAYVRGMFQAAFNNLPVAAADGVRRAILNSNSNTDSASFERIFGQSLIDAYQSRNDNGANVVARTR